MIPLSEKEILRILDKDTLGDLQEMATEIQVVTTEKEAKHALSMALQSRKLEKTLDTIRANIVKPHFEYQKYVNSVVKDFREKLVSIEEHLHGKIDTWMQEQNENPFTPIEKLEVEDGTLTTKKSYEFMIEDDKLIPAEYKTIDKEAVEKAIKYGTRKIPGIKIVEKTETALRVKN